ncbi:hypothetical protein R6Q57_013543 [Mikania cordata]
MKSYLGCRLPEMIPMVVVVVFDDRSPDDLGIPRHIQSSSRLEKLAHFLVPVAPFHQTIHDLLPPPSATTDYTHRRSSRRSFGVAPPCALVGVAPPVAPPTSTTTGIYHHRRSAPHLPRYQHWRTSSLFPCAALFDGNAATGNCKWSSTQTTSIVGSSSIHRVQQFLLMDTEDDAGTSQHNTPEETVDPSFKPTPNDMKKALQYLIKGKGPTVLECSDKLKLVGLDPVDPLFLAAYHIFGVSTGMREAWMALPDLPEVLKGWLAMKAGSLGLIK